MSPARAARDAVGLHTLWVQILVSAALAAFVVLWVAPRVRARTLDARPLAFGERPRGYVPVEEVLYRLRPAELGAVAWRPGQFAEYDLRALEEGTGHAGVERRRRMRVDVLRRVESADRHVERFGMPGEAVHWLRLAGIRSFREKPHSVYRMVGPRDLRVSDAQPCLESLDGYFPLRNGSLLSAEERLELVPLGEELLDVGDAALLCERFELALRSPGREEERVGELWFNRKVAPLGVVQLRVAAGALRLVAFGAGPPPELEEPLTHLVEGRSALADFCDSCHGETCRDKIYPPR